MMKQIFMSCCLFVFVLIHGACADLYSALQGVYDNNPVINQGRSTVDMAHADIKAANAQWMPYLGLHGNMDVARTKVSEYTFDYTPVQYGVEFQQNIFQGGAMFAQTQMAKSMYDAALANMYAIEQDVFLNAINAYVAVLNAGEVLRLNENNLRVLEQYFDFVNDQYDVGRLTKTDVSQATARLEMARYAVVDAQAQYDNAIETFRRIYGGVEPEYMEISLEPVSGLFPKSIDVAEENALRWHPMLIALDEQEQAAKQNINIAYKSILPSVDIRGAIQQVDSVPYLDELRDSRIGVYVKVPIFDKGNAFANADKVRATVANIQDKIIDARRTIIENLRSAWNIYQSQEYAILATLAGVDANKVALDGVRDEEKRGRRTVLDVLNAEQELLNSRVAHARAKHARIAAYFAVLAAVGRLDAENLGIKKKE